MFRAQKLFYASSRLNNEMWDHVSSFREKSPQKEGKTQTRRELSWGEAIWGQTDRPANEWTDGRSLYRGAMHAPDENNFCNWGHTVGGPPIPGRSEGRRQDVSKEARMRKSETFHSDGLKIGTPCPIVQRK
jgi:hypothetical protein